MKAGHVRFHSLLTSACLSLSVLGCSNSHIPSTGIVRFSDGERVQSGSIEFRSLANRASFASRIAADGSFTLTKQGGNAPLPAGEYEVVVVQIVLTEDLAADAHQHGRTVPRRYSDYYTSGLRHSQQADRTAPIEIKLKSGS